MKTIFKILIGIVFIFTFSGDMQAQRYSFNEIVTVVQGDSIYKVEIHKGLTKYFNEMIDKMLENNVDLSRLSDFEGMYIYGNLHRYVGYEVWGVSVRNDDQKDFIYISNIMPQYLPTFVSAIIYHEFYHFLTKQGHCIMDDVEDSYFDKLFNYFNDNDLTCPYVMQSGDKINVEVVIKEWNEHAKDYFVEYIKKQQK